MIGELRRDLEAFRGEEFLYLYWGVWCLFWSSCWLVRLGSKYVGEERYLKGNMQWIESAVPDSPLGCLGECT